MNEKPSAFHIFLTGGAGTGKSQIVKAINYEATRLFSRTMQSPEALPVLLTAFTGTAAFNVGGCTIQCIFIDKIFAPPIRAIKSTNSK